MPIKKAPSRGTLYKLLGMAKTQLAIHEDDYRAMQVRHGAKAVDGKVSAKSMLIWQLVNLLDELKTKGFKVKPKFKGQGSSKSWRAPRLAYIKSLWLLLADSDHEKSVREGDELAMNTYIKRQCKGLSRVDWITSQQLNQVIASLQSWCKRVGMDDADYKTH